MSESSDTTAAVPGAPAPPASPWRNIWTWLTLLISVVLLAVLLLRFEDWSLLTRVDPLWLVPAMLVSLLLNALAAPAKFFVVAAWLGVRIRFRDVWRLWVGLLPIANFMPFESGTLLFAVGLGRQPGIGFRQSFTAAVYDKYVSLVGLCALVAAGQLLIPEDHALASPWLLAGATAAVLFYLFDTWMLRLAARTGLLPSAELLVGRPECPTIRMLVLVLAVAIQGSDLIVVYLAARSLGLQLDPGAVLGVYPMVRLLTMIPITVNGYGAREALTVLFLGSWLSYDQGTAVGLLLDLVGYVLPALFGLVILRKAVAMLGGSWNISDARKKDRPEPG